MKEEKLFEIVRDEQGYLIVQLTGTGISAFLPFNICQQMKEEWELKTPIEEWWNKKDLIRKEQVVKMLKEALEESILYKNIRNKGEEKK